MSSTPPLPYKKEIVNLDIAESIPDYEFTSRAFINLLLDLNPDQSAKEQLLKRTTEERTLYYACKLDMQVLNGGVWQYFGNYGNEFDEDVSAALLELGLTDIASRFNQVAAVSTQQYEIIRPLLKSFDSFYYECDKIKSMNEWLKEYIIANIKVFQY